MLPSCRAMPVTRFLPQALLFSGTAALRATPRNEAGRVLLVKAGESLKGLYYVGRRSFGTRGLIADHEHDAVTSLEL